LYARNTPTDRAATGQSEMIGGPVSRTIYRIAAGDISGDGTAEAVGLEDGGWFSLASDHLAVYRFSSSGVSEIGSSDVHGHSIDVSIADLDADRTAELTVLRDDGYVEIWHGSSTASLSYGSTSATSNTGSPVRM